MIDSCSLLEVFSFYEIFWSPGLKKNNIQSRGEPFGILVVFESRGEPFGQNVLLELLFKVGANHSEFRMVRPRSLIFKTMFQKIPEYRLAKIMSF